ncbi:MAG: DUF4349 domain-containing protein [Vicinamibacteria bacterium]
MKRFGLFVLLGLSASLGCDKRPAGIAELAVSPEASSLEMKTAMGFDRPQAAPSVQAEMSRQAPAPTTAAPSQALRATSSLKLIWTASLNVEVPSYPKAIEAAAQAARTFGGYASDRQSSEDEAGHHRGSITLRIPSDRFDGAMSALKGLGRVRNEAINTQDVTKQYADLETRLKVKRETATRLREILVRQTGKVSEVLEVEREIARVVEEIEQAEGERLYFDNLISLSTITLQLYEPDSIVTPGALDPIISALKRSLRTMSESVGALVLITAGLLPWLVALYFVFRIVRWRWSRRAASKAPAASPQQ